MTTSTSTAFAQARCGGRLCGRGVAVVAAGPVEAAPGVPAEATSRTAA